MTQILLQQLWAGVFSACFLFLCSVGLSLVFGAGNFFNFAHGSFFMLGAYMHYALAPTGVGFASSVVLASTIVGLLGVALYLGLVARFPNASDDFAVQVLTTYALLLIISDAVRYVWGSGFVSVPMGRSIANGAMSSYQNLVIVATAIVALCVVLILHSTHAGRLVRASTSDAGLLRHLGRRSEAVTAGVFAGASALAAMGGAIAVPFITITPFTGDELIVMALIVSIVGGRGNAVGALLAAVLISELVAVANLFAPRLATAIPYIAAVAVLATRPSGLLQATASDATTVRA